MNTDFMKENKKTIGPGRCSREGGRACAPVVDTGRAQLQHPAESHFYSLGNALSGEGYSLQHEAATVRHISSSTYHHHRIIVIRRERRKWRAWRRSGLIYKKSILSSPPGLKYVWLFEKLLLCLRSFPWGAGL